MACTPRIALCGGLMIGVESMEPNTPPLEIENVPPVSSSMVSFPYCARLPKSAIVLLDLGKPHLFDVAKYRHHQSAGLPIAMPMSK